MYTAHKSMLAIAIAVLLPVQAFAGIVPAQNPPAIIDCVSPKSKIDKSTGNLVGKFLNIRGRPDAAAPPFITVGPAHAFGVIERQNGFLKIIGLTDSVFKTGEPIGWVKEDEIMGQGLRNCID